MEQGDILFAEDRKKHVHPIIYIERKDSRSFYSCLVSHEDGKGNIKMEPEHFHDKDEDGNTYPVHYDASYLIPQNFEKLNLWIKDETVIGKLTVKGIAFMLDNIPSNKEALFHPKPIWEFTNPTTTSGLGVLISPLDSVNL